MDKNTSTRVVVVIIIVLVAILVFSLLLGEKPQDQVPVTEEPTRSSEEPADPTSEPNLNNLRTYSAGPIVFDYPATLSVSSLGETVSLVHFIPHLHPDPCDFRGDGRQLDTITDFDLTMTLFAGSLRDVMTANETDYLMNNFFRSSAPTISPGFIDSFSAGNLHGYQITSGVEGCGYYHYYFPLSTNEILFARRAFVPEFQPINGSYQTYLNLPGIIPPSQEELIFKSILTSLRTN